MDWEDAIAEAKEELGYSESEYIEDWDEIVEHAQLILEEHNQNLISEMSSEGREKHRIYLKSDKWKVLMVMGFLWEWLND